jgi:hypothetical protein
MFPLSTQAKRLKYATVCGCVFIAVEPVLQPEVGIRNGVLERVIRKKFFSPKTMEVSKD